MREARRTRRIWWGLAALLLVLGLAVFSGPGLRALGRWLVVSEPPTRVDAVVVLFTGVDYYPRLMEAAALYGAGFAERVVINGNRKSKALRDLEQQGFRPCCPWYEDTLRILETLGVPRKKVLTVSAEDAYDTVSEAEAVAPALREAAITSIIITTSKFHTRRARYIWHRAFSGELEIHTVAAHTDPFSPDSWWRDGRQVRWVLTEYGAWLYYFWKAAGGMKR